MTSVPDAEFATSSLIICLESECNFFNRGLDVNSRLCGAEVPTELTAMSARDKLFRILENFV
jgi:hypothetical protein